MMLKAILIVFLFLVRSKCPSNSLTIQVIRNCYSNDIVKLVRLFEKLDYKYRKLLLDLCFLKIV